MGKVIGIFISPESDGEIVPINLVEAVAFSGLRGDRNFKESHAAPGNKSAITLIDVSQVQACNHELGTSYQPHDFRRNLVTEGVDLNELVGREFMIGNVRLRGYELCQPCGYISKKLGRDLLGPMDRRGGLRCWLLSSGEIKIGDKITV